MDQPQTESWPPPPFQRERAERYDELLDAVMDHHEANDWPLSRSVLARVLCEEKGLSAYEAKELVRQYSLRRGVLPTKWQAVERAASRVTTSCTVLCFTALVGGPVVTEELLRRHSPRSVITRALHLERDITLGAVLAYVIVCGVCLLWLEVQLRHLRDRK